MVSCTLTHLAATNLASSYQATRHYASQFSGPSMTLPAVAISAATRCSTRSRVHTGGRVSINPWFTTSLVATPVNALRSPRPPKRTSDELWSSISTDFMCGIPRDVRGHTSRLQLLYVVAIPVKDSVSGHDATRLFFDNVFCRFGLPRFIVSDRDPRSTAHFWSTLFDLCDTDLAMSTSDHPESDGQTERANRVLEDILRSYSVRQSSTWSTSYPTQNLHTTLRSGVHRVLVPLS
ncbi:hypothetical protein AaE_010028, partial [Aphanomyces astaci]